MFVLLSIRLSECLSLSPSVFVSFSVPHIHGYFLTFLFVEKLKQKMEHIFYNANLKKRYVSIWKTMIKILFMKML